MEDKKDKKETTRLHQALALVIMASLFYGGYKLIMWMVW